VVSLVCSPFSSKLVWADSLEEQKEVVVWPAGKFGCSPMNLEQAESEPRFFF
jgi:hypothetical protein